MYDSFMEMTISDVFILHFRYVTILSDAVSELLPESRTREATHKDALDVFIDHRITSAQIYEDQMHGQDLQDAANRPKIEDQFPKELLRRFEVYFKPRSGTKPLVLRSLRADQVIHNYLILK